jgi:hypothetical protein
MENSHKSLAKKLDIPRTSYIRYLKAGMSLDLDDAYEYPVRYDREVLP